MVLTQAVLNILVVLRRYKFLSRAQIQRLFYPRDKDGSVTRDMLRKMKRAGLCRALHPAANSSAPVVYVPTDAGCSLLAAHTGNMYYLLDCQPNTKAWVNFHHYIGVSDLFIRLDQALKSQNYVTMPKLFFEHDIVNADESDPSKKFKLYTRVSDKIVAVPDAASEIHVLNFCRAYYWEYETGSNSPARASAVKSPGYNCLNQSQKFKLHFPEAQDMRVIAVCPNTGWRDAMRKAMRDKQGSELWLFASSTDLNFETFLHTPILHTASDEKPKPLVKAPVEAPSPAPPQGNFQEASKEHPNGS